MKLREWDFNEGDSGGWVEVEYPDQIIQEFMNFTLNNKQWLEQLEIMYNRFLKLKRDLTDARNDATLEAAKVKPPLVDNSTIVDAGAIEKAADNANVLMAAAGSVA